MSIMKKTLKVTGMHCNGCASSIGRSLQRLEGVKEAKAYFEKGSAEIEFDDKKISLDKIVGTINELGFRVEEKL